MLIFQGVNCGHVDRAIDENRLVRRIAPLQKAQI